MVFQRRAGDMIHHLAVMVDHHHTGGLLVQLWAVQHPLRVGIGDDQQGAPGDRVDHILRLHKQAVCPCRLIPADQLCRHGGGAAHHGIGPLTQLACGHGQRRGTAEAVQIGQPVPHNQHHIAFCHQLTQGGGNHAGTHLCAALHPAGTATVEIEAIGGFYRRLVAAARLCHIQRLPGQPLTFLHGLALPDAHRQRDALPGIRKGGAHMIQHRKALPCHAVERPVLRNRHEAAGGILAQHAAGRRNPLIQHQLDLPGNAGTVAVPQIAGALLQIVDLEKQQHRAGGRIFGRQILQRCVIAEIQDIQAAVLIRKPVDISRQPQVAMLHIQRGAPGDILHREAGKYSAHGDADRRLPAQHLLL